MRCYELLKLPSLKSLQIVSGLEGLNRKIDWIYFSDTNNIENCINWINCNELFIMTGHSLNGDYEKLFNIIPLLNEKMISGILVNTGPFFKSIPDNIIDLSDNLRLPIFSLPWETRLVEATKAICSAIFLSETSANNSEFLHELLFNDTAKKEYLSEIISTTDFEFDKPYAIGIFTFYESNSDTNNIPYPYFNKILEINKILYSNAELNFKSYNIPIPMIQKDNSVIFLIQATSSYKSIIDSVLNSIHKDLYKRYPSVKLYAGVGRFYSSPFEYQISYLQAKKAISIAKTDEAFYPIANYGNLGIYTLLASLDITLLEEFYNDTFKGLHDYDRSNGSNLYETLKKYIYNSLNIQKTADEMFIHKNTLKYRLSKIEDILNCDFSNTEQISQFIMALKAGKMLKTY